MDWSVIMPRTYKCSFCGREIGVGTGLMHVKNDGTVLRFCSSKCRKNMLELKRVSRHFKWSSTQTKPNVKPKSQPKSTAQPPSKVP